MRLPTTAPILTVSGGILFPKAIVPFVINQARSVRLIEAVLAGNRLLVVSLQRAGWQSRERPESIGTLGLVRVAVRYQDETYGIFVQGLQRVRIGKTRRYKPYRLAEISPIKTRITDHELSNRLCLEALQEAAKRLEAESKALDRLREGPTVSNVQEREAIEALQHTLEELAEAEEAEQIADLLSAALISDPIKQQKILASVDLEVRLYQLIQFLRSDNHQTTHPNSVRRFRTD